MKPAPLHLILLLLLHPCNAFAHAMLMHANPGAGTVLHKTPAQVQLEFSEALEPAFSGITITDDTGAPAGSGAAGTSGTVMTLKLLPLRAGKYHVEWHAVSVDTHRTEGRYDFTVSP
ncbi:MAG: copper resistance protein CopC [Alphaproteobacteria bacterium]|nr:copper resistance protein CopC [Alphaproteobacteria bacterium]MBV9062519.1 copper resistance protein CopC [Alphaproteobacteria bacterium]